MGMRPPGRVLRTGDTAGDSCGAKRTAMGAVSGEMDGDSAGDSARCPTARVHRANLARIPMTELARILAIGTCPTPHWRRFGRLDTASVHIAKCPHVHVSTCPCVHMPKCPCVQMAKCPHVHIVQPAAADPNRPCWTRVQPARQTDVGAVGRPLQTAESSRLRHKSEAGESAVRRPKF
jgi:predicted metal-binding protein